MAKFKILAVVALATGALFLGPAAAQAAYVPAANITVTGVATPGGTVNVGFVMGSFTNGESVSVALSCDTTQTSTATATASGALSLDVVIPTAAKRTCTLTATGLTSGDVGTVTLTIVPADRGGAAGNAAGDGLADTGASDSTMLLIWGASGVLLLGVALVVVMATVRRQRANA